MITISWVTHCLLQALVQDGAPWALARVTTRATLMRDVEPQDLLLADQSS